MNQFISLTLAGEIKEADARKLLALKYQTDADGKKSRNILSVDRKRVDGGCYPENPAAVKFCERMTRIGIMNTIISSWGMEEKDFAITDLGLQAIKALKQFL